MRSPRCARQHAIKGRAEYLLKCLKEQHDMFGQQAVYRDLWWICPVGFLQQVARGKARSWTSPTGEKPRYVDPMYSFVGGFTMGNAAVVVGRCFPLAVTWLSLATFLAPNRTYLCVFHTLSSTCMFAFSPPKQDPYQKTATSTLGRTGGSVIDDRITHIPGYTGFIKNGQVCVGS